MTEFMPNTTPVWAVMMDGIRSCAYPVIGWEQEGEWWYPVTALPGADAAEVERSVELYPSREEALAQAARYAVAGVRPDDAAVRAGVAR